MNIKKLAPIAMAFGMAFGSLGAAHAADKPPNIVVIFGNDIRNVGTYTHEPRATVADGAYA